MRAKSWDWYKNNWSLEIKKQSWAEDTNRQVDFIIKTLHLNGSERILDLACGYGRHALRFAEKGYSVTGIDLTEDYILDARINAEKRNLKNISFIHTDIRSIDFPGEYDVVLNLADGAVGYLETEEENLKIFDVISKALKPAANILWISVTRNSQSFIFLCAGGMPAEMRFLCPNLSGILPNGPCCSAEPSFLTGNLQNYLSLRKGIP